MNTVARITMVLAAAIPGTAWADLPGMPVAPQAADTRTEQRPAAAQTGPVRGSLYKQASRGSADSAGPAQEGAREAPVTINFIAVAPSPAKRYRKNDIITVVIHEESDSTVNGKASSNKQQDFDLAIQQFLQLALSQSGVPTVGTVSNPAKLPEVKFKYQNNTSSDADQERQDSLSARLSGTVVDVKPNGTLVVEAVKVITVDKEEQVFKLSGVCRVEDIAADNTILSTQLANLSLSKQTKGDVTNGTKRGWLNQFLDRFSPF